MKNFGTLLRQVREKQALSRRQLSEDICTEKYLYMIETGIRNPSAEIIHLLSLRLGVDLFMYMEYLDCQRPLEVQHIITSLEACRATSNFEAALALCERAETMADFQQEPWIYYLQVIRCAHMVLVKGRRRGCVSCLQPIIANISPCYQEEDSVANIYILLGVCHLDSGNLAEAWAAVKKAESIAESRTNFPRSNAMQIDLGLLKTACHMSAGELDQAIETGLGLADILATTHSFGQANYVYCFLANAYYEKGSCEQAQHWFVHCLGDLILHNNAVAASLITCYGHFQEMLSTFSICSRMKADFLKLYGDMFKEAG